MSDLDLDQQNEAELRNPFPSPPSHYNNYTTHNLALLALLKERAEESGTEVAQVNQYDVLSDQTDVPDWPLQSLEKPRVDWIEEEGGFMVFGEYWPLKETIPSLAESGGIQMYSSDPVVDRRPALLTILKSMLVSYSHLLNALLAPPPSGPYDGPPDYIRHLDWIKILAQNIMAAANDMRPVQARGNLELMMQRQLELRREETSNIHSKCDELEAKLAQLGAVAQQNVGGEDLKAELVAALSSGSITQERKPDAAVSAHDVLCWAEDAK